jgi:hypothetical protein
MGVLLAVGFIWIVRGVTVTRGMGRNEDDRTAG